jgi:hypothetical protein
MAEGSVTGEVTWSNGVYKGGEEYGGEGTPEYIRNGGETGEDVRGWGGLIGGECGWGGLIGGEWRGKNIARDNTQN